jgi:hypothetical protein
LSLAAASPRFSDNRENHKKSSSTNVIRFNAIKIRNSVGRYSNSTRFFPAIWCLGQRKLTQIEIFPWNVGVSGHGGASADMPDQYGTAPADARRDTSENIGP